MNKEKKGHPVVGALLIALGCAIEVTLICVIIMSALAIFGLQVHAGHLIVFAIATFAYKAWRLFCGEIAKAVKENG